MEFKDTLGKLFYVPLRSKISSIDRLKTGPFKAAEPPSGELAAPVEPKKTARGLYADSGTLRIIRDIYPSRSGVGTVHPDVQFEVGIRP